MLREKRCVLEECIALVAHTALELYEQNIKLQDELSRLNKKRRKGKVQKYESAAV